jgi:hypothetical protein
MWNGSKANHRIMIQSLLYFTLHPPTPPLPPHTPTPLSILYKIASLHPTSALMAHHTIPIYPREKVDTPDWLYYEVNGEIERNVKKRMKGCAREGIWDLLWEGASISKDRKKEKEGRKGRKRARAESDDEEEEGEGRGEKRVSEKGWLVLEWLVHIWEKDQEERGGESFLRLHFVFHSHSVIPVSSAKISIVRIG